MDLSENIKQLVHVHFSCDEVVSTTDKLNISNLATQRELVGDVLELVKLTWPLRPKWCVSRLKFAFNTCPIETIYDLIMLHDILCALQHCYETLLSTNSPKLLRFIMTKNLIAQKILDHFDQ